MGVSAEASPGGDFSVGDKRGTSPESRDASFLNLARGGQAKFSHGDKF